jgi:hypothetical protein
MNFSNFRVLFISAAVMINFSACTSTTQIKYLEPSQVSNINQYKSVAIKSIKDDRVGLETQLQSALVKARYAKKPFFNVSKDWQSQSAFFTGSILNADSKNSYYYVDRTRCLDDKCKRVETYPVRCVKRITSLSAQLNMHDTQQSQIVFSDSWDLFYEESRCADQSGAFASSNSILKQLANNVAQDFVQKLIPHYVYLNVEIMEDSDIRYTSKEDAYLEGGVELLESGELLKAEQVFSRLVASTNDKSYVALYNLGFAD